MYCIIKQIPVDSGKNVPVVMMTLGEEIWELDKDEAHKIANLLTLNSDSGYIYTAKKL